MQPLQLLTEGQFAQALLTSSSPETLTMSRSVTLKTSRRPRLADSDVGLSVLLAIQIAIIFVVAPLAATTAISAQWIEMLRFGLAATTILIVARSTTVKLAIGLAFVGTLLATLHWQLGEPAAVVQEIKITASLGFDSVVATIVAFAAFGPGKVTVHRILGAVILYLYVALLFAGIYRLMALALRHPFVSLPVDPRARLSELLYFSLGVLTSAGSSGITPLHPLVRSLASFEAVIGQLFPATILARLVTLHTTNADADAPKQPSYTLIERGRSNDPTSLHVPDY